MIINFYGGAGSGKSTTAAHIFSQLRKHRYSAELATEFIKNWAYQGRACKSYDQLYVFASQVHSIDFYLQHNVKCVVCDSPILMQCIYTLKFKSPIHKELLSIAKKFYKTYPTIDIFLDRKNIPYETTGRYETYEEALELDKMMKRFLLRHIGKKLMVVDAASPDIFDLVYKELKKHDFKRETSSRRNKARAKKGS